MIKTDYLSDISMKRDREEIMNFVTSSLETHAFFEEFGLTIGRPRKKIEAITLRSLTVAALIRRNNSEPRPSGSGEAEIRTKPQYYKASLELQIKPLFS